MREMSVVERLRVSMSQAYYDHRQRKQLTRLSEWLPVPGLCRQSMWRQDKSKYYKDAENVHAEPASAEISEARST